MQKVMVLATGGTIATRTDSTGSAVARATGAELVQSLPTKDDVHVEVEDVFCVGGYLMTLELMRELALRAEHLFGDTDIAGLVVTHGTDTIEETAFFVDLFLDDPRAIVFTGAQRAADAFDSDGPRNIADAVSVAASPASHGLGALIVFGGAIFAARGARKVHTVASDTFAAPSGGPLGWVRDGTVHTELQPRRWPRLRLAALDLTGVRVDVAACYPGGDGTALQAFYAAGARGIVLEATGAGNANPAICDTVAELTRAGVVVALSTRVNAGPVAAIYAGGGGADLVAAGAIPTGSLRPPQVRVLVAALLGTLGRTAGPAAVRQAVADYSTG